MNPGGKIPRGIGLQRARIDREQGKSWIHSAFSYQRKAMADMSHELRLIAMKIVGHTDYKTTANIYTHVRDEMLKKATVNMGEVFGSREKGG